GPADQRIARAERGRRADAYERVADGRAVHPRRFRGKIDGEVVDPVGRDGAGPGRAVEGRASGIAEQRVVGPHRGQGIDAGAGDEAVAEAARGEDVGSATGDQRVLEADR